MLVSSTNLTVLSLERNEISSNGGLEKQTFDEKENAETKYQISKCSRISYVNFKGVSWKMK